MPNGVEVIVRGDKTTGPIGYKGSSNSYWLPQKVLPSRPVTLPGHTVSRQFHLKDNPARPVSGIGQLLQSLVRFSGSPDLITKTLLTTFTYRTTILKSKTNTVVKSHEETVANVVTQRFQSASQEMGEIIPITKELPSFTTIPPLFITSTLPTTYTYYNTFTVGGNIPMVLTSRETVSNIVTTTHNQLPVISTTAYATETHYSTYTFSKTMRDKSSQKVVTTRETVTQVVVTQSLAPVRTSLPLSPPTKGITYFTTFTYLQTRLGSLGNIIVDTKTSLHSKIYTTYKEEGEGQLMRPTSTALIAQTKTLTPVLLYATKVYYTTYTYFTTLRRKGATDTKGQQVHSRTQVVSKVVTEAMQTAFDISYVNKLKSSYLQEHSTLLDVTSHVNEIIPTKTEVVEEIEQTQTPVKSPGVKYPHFPKDEDEGVIEPVQVEHPVLFSTRKPIIISSSEEHFDEVKEGVNKIVSVLKQGDKKDRTVIKPTKTAYGEMQPTSLADIIDNVSEAYTEQIVSEDEDQGGGEVGISTTEDGGMVMTPVSHLPTPPLALRTSTERSSEPTSKGPLHISSSGGIMEQHVELDLFPDIGSNPSSNHEEVKEKENNNQETKFAPDYPGIEYEHSDEEVKTTTDEIEKRKGTTPPVTEEEEEVENEEEEQEEEPPKIYNIPVTFDTEAYNQQQLELIQYNETLVKIKEKGSESSTEFATTQEHPEEEEQDIDEQQQTTNVDMEQNEDEFSTETPDNNPTLPKETFDSSTETFPPGAMGNSTENLMDSESTVHPIAVSSPSLSNEDQPQGEEEDEAQVEEEEPEIEIVPDDEEEDITNNNVSSTLESPTNDDSNVTSTRNSNETSSTESYSPPSTSPHGSSSLGILGDIFTSEELAFVTGTTKRPTTTKTRYTTSKRPQKKRNKNKNNKVKENTKTPPPFLLNSAEEGENQSGESSTHIYNLKPIKITGLGDGGKPSSDEEEESVGHDENNNKDKKKNKPQDDDDSSSEEEKYKRKRKRPFHTGGGYSGPSKSAISFPIAASTGATLGTAASSSFNWKPLFNLGLVGLGGLAGASKLAPIIGSMMKGAVFPMARNDTSTSYYKKEMRPRPYYPHNNKNRFVPHPPPHKNKKEPNYIPLRDEGGNNYRYEEDEQFGRRRPPPHYPVHFKENEFMKQPDFVSGPLPPPIHHHYPYPEDLPPTNQINNYAPPHDQIPNMFHAIGHEMDHAIPQQGKTDHDHHGHHGPMKINLLNGHPIGQHETPVLRPTEEEKHPPIFMNPSRPDPGSIEMINEVKNPYHNPPLFEPELILPQRDKLPHHHPPPKYPQPEGPLRINLPGINIHTHEHGPWNFGDDRFHQNPFKDGKLNNFPKLVNIENQNPQAAEPTSHESFEPPFSIEAEEEHPHHNQGLGHFFHNNNKNIMMKPVKPAPVPPMVWPHKPQVINEIQRPNPDLGSVSYWPPKPPPPTAPPGYQKPVKVPVSEYHFPVQGQNVKEQPINVNVNSPRPNNPTQVPPWKEKATTFTPPKNRKPPPKIQRIVNPPHLTPPPPSTVYIVEENEEEQHNNNRNSWNHKNFHILSPPNFNNNSNSRMTTSTERNDDNNVNFNNPGQGGNTLVITELTNTNKKPPTIAPFPKFKSTTFPTTITSTTTTSPPRRASISTIQHSTATTPSPPPAVFTINRNYTTGNGTSSNNNRGLISKLFIRRFTTTTQKPSTLQSQVSKIGTFTPSLSTTASPSPTPTPIVSRTSTTTKRSLSNLFPAWGARFTIPTRPPTTTTTKKPVIHVSNQLLKDLLNLEEKLKQKYGPRKPIGSLFSASEHKPSQTDNNRQNHRDGSLLEEEEEEEDYSSSGSHEHRPTRINVTTTQRTLRVEDDRNHHSNHHPVHKPPIDVTKYLKDVDEDEFGQLYQGSEDKDVVVDPVTKRIIKHPQINKGKNNNQFMRRTTEKISTAASANIMSTSTLSASEEEKILKKFTVPQDLVFTSTPPAFSKLWWPSGVTTFRPQQDPSSHLIAVSNISKRPGSAPHPQHGGMNSFYDDPDSLNQIQKMKNKEIHKLSPVPSTTIALVKPEEVGEVYEKQYSSREVGKVKNPLRNKGGGVGVKEYPEFPEGAEEAGTSYEETEYPNVPSTPASKSSSKDNSKIQVVVPTTKQTIKLSPSSKKPQFPSSNEIGRRPEGPLPPGQQETKGHRESSYIYEEEYYEDEDGEDHRHSSFAPPIIQNQDRNKQFSQSQIDPQGKIVFFPKLPPSAHHTTVGGHKVNNLPPRPPRPQIIFQETPKTEMEPPPIDSNRLKSPILELPSSGPIKSSDARPNLLRPDEGKFFNKNQRNNDTNGVSKPSIHTVASVDDYNKIIGTQQMTAVIIPSKSSEAKVVIPSKTGSAEIQVSSVVKYTGGKLQNKGNNNGVKVHRDPDSSGGGNRGNEYLKDPNSYEEDEDDVYYNEEEEEELPKKVVIQPSRAATPPSIQRTRKPQEITSTPKPVSPNSSSRRPIVPTHRPHQIVFKPSPSSTRRPTNSKEINSGGNVVRRPFIPTRGPGPNIVPWARRPQVTTTIQPPSSSSPVSNNSNRRDNSTPSTVVSFSSSSSSPVENDLKRPVTTMMVSVSSTTSTSDYDDKEEYYEGDSNEIPSKPGPPPPNKPREGGTSSEVVDRNRLVTLLTKYVPSQGNVTLFPTSTTRKPFINTRGTTRMTTRTTTTTTIPPVTTRRFTPPPSIFQNVTTYAPPASSFNPDEEEYEEYSYEDDVNNATSGIPSPSLPTRTNDDDLVNQTVSVVTQISAEISPTRIRNKATVTLPREKVEEREDDITTRYITRVDSSTVTITETEVSSTTRKPGGWVQTATIYVTKTVPPETLISTVVGSVTLVNTVEIKPTVVRSTVLSEPTRIPHNPTFVDNSNKELKDILVTKKNYNQPTNKNRGSSTSSPNSQETPSITPPLVCPSNCSSTQNLACRPYANGTRTKCDCKPGYARMKPKYPCRPTYTYELTLGIQKMDGMQFSLIDLQNAATDGYHNFIGVTKDAIDKAFLSTDIKRQFQGSEVIRVNPKNKRKNNDYELNIDPTVHVDFLVQLTTNITEDRIKNHFLRVLRNSNFSLGRTGVTSTRNASSFLAKDFNECESPEWNDCSPNAECLNVRGSFTCQCKVGFKDRSKRRPGRECQETSGCAECNFHGTCHRDSKQRKTCHCFKWYGGSTCQINLKILLIAITGIGSVLFILVMLCGTLICKRGDGSRGKMSRQVPRPERTSSGRFMRYRSPNSQANLEHAAIINDSASSDGAPTVGHNTSSPHPPLLSGHPTHHTHSFTPDSLLIDHGPSKIVSTTNFPHPSLQHLRHEHPHPHSLVGRTHSDANLINFSLRNVVDGNRGDGGDNRLLQIQQSIIIPRAKIRTPSRPNSTHTMNPLPPMPPQLPEQSSPSIEDTERKLIDYLNQNANKLNQTTRKFSLQERKVEGALVSSGEAVSAIGGIRRKSTTALLDPMIVAEPTYAPYTKSVSEVRSYDETIRCPAAKSSQLYTTDTSRTSCYSCKPPSYYSESHCHTMGDKDGASTVYTTKAKLFRVHRHHDDHHGPNEDTSSTASSQ